MGRREELEAQLDAHRDDAALFAVYFDLLLELGDPLAELIQLQRRAEAAPDDRALAKERDRAEARFVARPLRKRTGATWKHGFLRAIEISLDDEESLDFEALVAALSTLPGRFIHRLGFTGTPIFGPGYVPAIRRLLAGLPQVTEVGVRIERALGLYEPRYGGPICILDALPAHTERVEISGRAGLGGALGHLGLELPLPRLNEVRLCGVRLEADDVSALRAARARVASRCSLTLPLPGATFTFDQLLDKHWPDKTVEAVDGAGLLVTAPTQHAGLCLPFALTERTPRDDATVRLGDQINCDLFLPDSGLIQVHAIVRRPHQRPSLHPVGPVARNGSPVPQEGVPLAHGDRLSLGRAEVAFFTHDLAGAWRAERDRWRAK